MSPRCLYFGKFCSWNKWEIVLQEKDTVPKPRRSMKNFKSSNIILRECQLIQVLKLLILFYFIFFCIFAYLSKVTFDPLVTEPFLPPTPWGKRPYFFSHLSPLFSSDGFLLLQNWKKTTNTVLKETMGYIFKALFPNYSLPVWLSWFLEVAKDQGPLKSICNEAEKERKALADLPQDAQV